jgi:hypothetical protein
MIGNEILRDKYGEKIGEVQMNGSKCTLRAHSSPHFCRA